MLKELFISFFKIGLFTFGGGYAMLPLIEKELVEKRKWITEEELLEMFIISQMTPGTIAINASTFIGSKKAGKSGGFVASLGIIFPSLIIITLIYNFLGESFDNPVIHSIFSGIRACIIGLIASSTLKICRKSFISGMSYIIFIIAFILLLIFDINPILLIILGALIGATATFFLPNKIKSLLEVK
ncbi:chromate transporter [Psychrilyobacter sp.]|uniref:chromate transporter n=1 Tax=Psychrilyobacter sp. TaxID=2586924 RepID=UPI003015939A